MKKILLSIVTALVLIGCSSTTSITPEQQAIDRVFAADVNFPRNSASISQLVLSKRTLSLAGAPADFVSAYKANIAAWEKMVDIEKKMYAVNRESAARDINRFLNAYVSDSPRAFVTLRNNWSQFAEELDKAFQEIERTRVAYKTIGARYSAIYPSLGLF